MMFRPTRPRPESLPATSPAIHFLRPIFLTVASLLAYGLYTRHPTVVVTALALGFVALLPALVLHTSYRRRQEQTKKIVCG
jgi:Flp pilus assembly protein TadB